MSKRKCLVLTVLILLIGASLRFYKVGATGVTTDEALTYRRTTGTLQERLEDIAGPGNHVPLYFLSAEILPHQTDLGLRSGSLFLGLLGIALFIAVARAFYHDDRLAFLIGAWVAVSPYMVFYSRDARPYAMLFVLSLLTCWLFLRLVQGERSGKMWALFIGVSMATYVTHYAGAALPISQFIVLLWLREKVPFIARWIAAQALASLPTFLWLMLYASPKGEPNNWITIPNLGRPYYTLTNITIGYEAHPTWYFVLALLFLTPGLFMGIYHILKQKPPHPANALWLTVAFFPMLLLFAISQFRPLYVERYFMATAPAMFLVIVIGWQALRERMPLFLSAGVVIAVAAGVTVNELATTHFEDQDWRASTAYMLDHFADGDGILLNGPHETAFWYYYRGNPTELVMTNDTMDGLYQGSLTLCTLPYARLWGMTGSHLHSEAEMLFVDATIIEKREYHNITVRLVDLRECP